MQDREKLFNDFPAVAKEEWMEKVRQELRDRPWEEIQWALTQTIRLDPFFHPNDRVEPAGPGTGRRRTIGRLASIYLSIRILPRPTGWR